MRWKEICKGQDGGQWLCISKRSFESGVREEKDLRHEGSGMHLFHCRGDVDVSAGVSLMLSVSAYQRILFKHDQFRIPHT